MGAAAKAVQDVNSIDPPAVTPLTRETAAAQPYTWRGFKIWQRLAMSRTADRVYSKQFFEDIRATSLNSARAAAPKILQVHPARSVIDVGSGIGTWLKAFHDLGVAKIAGLDGDYVDRSQLMIPAARFVSCNLDQPIDIADVYHRLGDVERFEMAMSLEVGEHLPPARATSLVSDLCALSDVVLFGAAIPFQGWQRAHVNEQWQSYWADKFLQNGYDAFDALRPLIWSSPEIVYFYKQNAIFYVKQDTPAHQAFMARCGKPTVAMFDIVHPEHYRSGVVRRKHGNFVQKFLNDFRLSGGRRRSTVLTTHLNGDDHWNSKTDSERGSPTNT
jgi:SAM-dependent methyltransferase